VGAGVDAPPESPAALPLGDAQLDIRWGGEVEVCAAGGGGDGEGVQRRGLSGVGAQQQEDVHAVGYALFGPLRWDGFAGFGDVEVDHDQPGRAGGQADVVVVVVPAVPDACGVGGGALFGLAVPSGADAGAGALGLAVQGGVAAPRFEWEHRPSAPRGGQGGVQECVGRHQRNLFWLR
jgi:hypothetical protein